jgi:hypothetical protein
MNNILGKRAQQAAFAVSCPPAHRTAPVAAMNDISARLHEGESKENSPLVSWTVLKKASRRVANALNAITGFGREDRKDSYLRDFLVVVWPTTGILKRLLYLFKNQKLNLIHRSSSSVHLRVLCTALTIDPGQIPRRHAGNR